MSKWLIFGMIALTIGNPQIACAAVPQGDSASESEQKIMAHMPPEWRSCNQSSDCEIIYYNCNGAIAVNTKYLSEARKLAYQIEHNPATIECEYKPTGRLAPLGRTVYMAGCGNNQCQAAPGE